MFSPRPAGFVLDAFAGQFGVAEVDEDLDRLTEREREVMRLIARGYACKEVAAELFISIKPSRRTSRACRASSSRRAGTSSPGGRRSDAALTLSRSVVSCTGHHGPPSGRMLCTRTEP